MGHKCPSEARLNWYAPRNPGANNPSKQKTPRNVNKNVDFGLWGSEEPTTQISRNFTAKKTAKTVTQKNTTIPKKLVPVVVGNIIAEWIPN
jgi:hypothetical protein